MTNKTVLEYWLEKHQTVCNTLTDISFDNISFLTSREPILNAGGERVSKSYYHYPTGKEAIRITYSKIYGDHTFENVTYKNVFLGLQKTINHLNFAGDVSYKIEMPGHYFTLNPVFENGIVVGFTSLKMRRILAVEAYYANEMANN